MRGGILRRFRLRAACLLAAASLSLSPPIVAWAQQSSDQQAAPAPGADYSRIEIDAKLSAGEASSIARLDVLAQRVANAESRLADAREYLDRLLLIFLVSIVLVLFLFANNLRLHHRGATQRILRISREAEIALGGLKREMANPEMENMRTAQALRTMMRRLREGSLSALPPNLAAQVEAAAAHPHLPVMVHLMAVALLSEQRADWRGARAHLARLHEMDERDADVLLHLSHVHRRLAEKFGDENDMKMSYRYYTRFAMNEGRSDPQFELPPPPATTVAATETVAETTIAIEAKKEAATATAAATPAPAVPAAPATPAAAEILAPILDSPRPPETRTSAAASNGGAPPPAQSAPPSANQPRPLVPPPQWKTAPPAVEKTPPPAPPSAPIAAKPQPQIEPPPVAKAPPPAPAVVKAQPQVESPPPSPPPPPVAKTPPPASLAAKLQLQNKPPAPPPIAAKPQPQNTPPPQAASDKGWRLSKMFRRTPKEESKIVAPVASVAPVAPQAPQAKVSPVVAQNAAPQPRPQEPPLRRPPLPPNPDSPPSRPKPPPPKPSIAAPPHPSLPHIPTAMPPVGAPPPKPPVAAASAGKEMPAPPPPKIETPPKSALLGKLASVAAQAKSRPAPPPPKAAIAPAPPESPKPAPKAAPQPSTKPTQPVAAPTAAPTKTVESPPRQSNGKADGGIKKRFLAGINGFGFAKKPAPQLPSIPADVSDAERKMWIEIRAAEEWAHKSRAAKTRSRRGKLMDKALARYEAAQNHKTSRKLYYDWGVAYVGRALIEPEEKRSYFLAAAADKFIAGNVNAPHAFDFHLASIYALMKDDKKCEHWLSQAAEHGGLDAAALSADPEFETMRGKDWFRRFLA